MSEKREAKEPDTELPAKRLASPAPASEERATKRQRPAAATVVSAADKGEEKKKEAPELEPMDVGAPEWENIRRLHYAVVDKTLYALELAKEEARHIFIRPRRQGKTALVDMMRALLSGPESMTRDLLEADKVAAVDAARRALFTGTKAGHALDVEDWQSLGPPRPVVHLVLTRVVATEGREVLKQELRDILLAEAERLGIKLREAGPHMMFEQLLANAHERYGVRVGLLIDEYDTPFVKVLNANGGSMGDNVEYVRDVFSDVFAVLKSAQKHTWCQLITGATRFAVGNVLSGPNAEATRAAQALAAGFTRAEVEATYPQRLRELARLRFGGDIEAMWRELTDLYGGISYIAGTEPLFNTWDMVCALKHFELDRFWSNTSKVHWLYKAITPQFLDAWVSKGEVVESAASHVDKDRWLLDLMTGNGVDRIEAIDSSAWALRQAGLLTIKRRDDNGALVLAVPNRAARQDLLDALKRKVKMSGKIQACTQIDEAFSRDDVKAMFDAANNLTEALLTSRNFSGERNEVNIMRMIDVYFWLSLQEVGLGSIRSELGVLAGFVDMVIARPGGRFLDVVEAKAVEDNASQETVDKVVRDSAPQVREYAKALLVKAHEGTYPEYRGRTVRLFVVIVVRGRYLVKACQEVPLNAVQ